MKILESKFVQGFIKMANDGYLQGWHERNGGNLSYRLKPEEVEMIRPRLHAPGAWIPIGVEVPGLAGEVFLVTGSGKYFRNIIVDPEVCLAIIELDETGTNYRIRWGLVEGGRPTSELPTHLMNHEVKKKLTNGKHRVIYHAHTTNTIALTFVLPLDDKIFTRELWESATECPVVFPDSGSKLTEVYGISCPLSELPELLLLRYCVNCSSLTLSCFPIFEDSSSPRLISS